MWLCEEEFYTSPIPYLPALSLDGQRDSQKSCTFIGNPHMNLWSEDGSGALKVSTSSCCWVSANRPVVKPARTTRIPEPKCPGARDTPVKKCRDIHHTTRDILILMRPVGPSTRRQPNCRRRQRTWGSMPCSTTVASAPPKIASLGWVTCKMNGELRTRDAAESTRYPSFRSWSPKVNLNHSKNNKIHIVASLHPAAFRLEEGGGRRCREA
jgi:hypothetical protein